MPTSDTSLKIENLQVSGKHTLQVINESEISTSVPVSPLANPYVILLINMSNHCFTLMRTRNLNQNWGTWFAIPQTCKTCTFGSYQDCFTAKAWRQILVTDCTSQPFEIEIATKPDDSGMSHVYSYDAIVPNCSYAGGAIGAV